MNPEPKIVVAISGASGAIYAKRLLDHLRKTSATVAIVMSDHARQIWTTEVGTDVRSYDYKIYDKTDFNAPFASGSNVWDALAIVPCSMGMLGRIAHGFSDDLIARAADVFMKERRK
ncbi:MAG: UbiX family flavin prenyltransferase, partial [Sideroxyarcus sp.]|nr:UbiX family flavin prenyltransferase [Sideroxyarcus sp.]